MIRFPLPCVAAFCLSAIFSGTTSAQPAATAQPNGSKAPAPVKDANGNKVAKDPEAERLIRERHAQDERDVGKRIRSSGYKGAKFGLVLEEIG